MAERLYTIPVTCCRDGQAHDVTDESATAGRRTGNYQALYGYVVVAAPMALPDASAHQAGYAVMCEDNTQPR